MATDTEVQVNAPGSGAKVSTLGIDRQNDVDTSGNAGSAETVHQQVVSTADRHGDLVTSFDEQILVELKAIHQQLVELNMRLS